MKKITKGDFKKMALMGIAGGAMVASGAAEANTSAMDYSHALAANCNSKHGCKHSDDQAYRSVPQQGQYYYNQQGYATCGGAQPQWQPQPQGQISSACGGAQPQWQPQPSSAKLTAGCGSARSSKGQDSGVITKWETADNGKTSSTTPDYNETVTPDYKKKPTYNNTQQYPSGQTATPTTTPAPKSPYADSGKMAAAPMTESEFTALLTTEKETFKKMDSETKKLALELAPQYADKNQAVKAAAKKMAEKRSAPKY